MYCVRVYRMDVLGVYILVVRYSREGGDVAERRDTEDKPIQILSFNQRSLTVLFCYFYLNFNFLNQLG